jgi:alpha-mannosidase
MEHERRLALRRIETQLALVEPLVCRQREPIGDFRYFEHADASEAGQVGCDVDDSRWQVVGPQTYWGKWHSNFTLRSRFRVPLDWKREGAVGLVLRIGEVKNWDFCHPEALVWIDGEAVAGCDKFHQQIPLPARFCDANEHLLALHGYTGRWGYFENGPTEKLFMKQCEVVQVDKPTQDFVALVRVALGTVRALEEKCPARGRILTALEKAFRILDTREPFEYAFYNSVPAALQALKSDLQEAGPSLDVNVTAVVGTDPTQLWTFVLHGAGSHGRVRRVSIHPKSTAVI